MNPEVERLVEDIIPQARSEAWKVFNTAPHALELDELVSLAYQGLAQAAQRWPEYCERRGFDAGCGQRDCADKTTCGTRYFAAYALRRIRGSMLDAMRSGDWVTRSVRGNAKALRDAGQDLGMSEQELASKTGMTVQKVRDTLAAMARKPVSMDAEPVDVSEDDDVEGQAVVNSITAAATGAIQSLPPEQQMVVALRFYGEMEFREIAELLEIREARVSQLHEEGVAAVHEAMIHAARE
jgi:RNA polymerase sigma factor for flagellar operon FliA